MRIFKTQEEFDKEVVNGVFKAIDDVKFEFDLETGADIDAKNINARNIKAWNINTWNIKAWNIDAGNIDAWNIKAWNIDAGNIDAWDIKAGDISYYAVCFAYSNITCTSIKGSRKNCKHFCLDSEITIKEKKHIITIDGKDIKISEESYNELKKQLK